MVQALPLPQLESRSPSGIDVLTDDALFAANGVRIAFTGRSGGFSEAPYASLNTGSHVGDDPHVVSRNRLTILRALGFTAAPLLVPAQVHGTHIVRVGQRSDVLMAADEAIAGADAIAVGRPGVAALLNFADCLPLIIATPDGRFAVVHAGWRGALAGISGMAVRALAQFAPADGAPVEGAEDPATFNAYIGPHIRSECFEVGADVAAQFAERYGQEAIADERHVDLSRAVSVDLERAGMDARRIADAGICTVCSSDRYFSYRAEGGTCGRHAAVAMRV